MFLIPDAPAGREIPERSQRDPREIPERLISRTLYRERTHRDPEPREIPERSQRDPERDPTSLHRVSDPGISPPRLKLYNVYTQKGWGPAVCQHCMDPSASDGCTCQSPCSFALSPLTSRLLKTRFFLTGVVLPVGCILLGLTFPKACPPPPTPLRFLTCDWLGTRVSLSGGILGLKNHVYLVLPEIYESGNY